MFQLNKIVNFDTLIKVVEESKKKVIEEKNIKDVKVELISINAPNNGDFNSMESLQEHRTNQPFLIKPVINL